MCHTSRFHALSVIMKLVESQAFEAGGRGQSPSTFKKVHISPMQTSPIATYYVASYKGILLHPSVPAAFGTGRVIITLSAWCKMTQNGILDGLKFKIFLGKHVSYSHAAFGKYQILQLHDSTQLQDPFTPQYCMSTFRRPCVEPVALFKRNAIKFQNYMQIRNLSNLN